MIDNDDLRWIAQRLIIGEMLYGGLVAVGAAPLRALIALGVALLSLAIPGAVVYLANDVRSR